MLKQPRALYLLNFVSMWECFSYYGMRALLVLYMIKELRFSEGKAFALYAAYTTLAELGGVAGGVVADRCLGLRRAVACGGWIILLGHVCLAAFNEEAVFFTALALIVVGTSLFRTNVPALLGTFYGDGDVCRDAGYTLYYAGINVGGFLASIFCVLVAEVYGWHAGFGLAALGMLMGMIALMVGKPMLIAPVREMGEDECVSLRLLIKKTFEARRALKIVCAYVFFLVIFYACEEQLGSTMVVFAERFVDRQTFLGEIPAPMLMTVNPLTILLVGPFVSRLLLRCPLSDSAKIALSFILLSSAFGLLRIGGIVSATDGAVRIGYALGSIFFIGLGELFIGPTVYAIASNSAPRGLAGVTMGIVTLGFSLANVFSGFLSQLMAFEEGTVVLEGYLGGFTIIGLVALVPLVFLFKMKRDRKVLA